MPRVFLAWSLTNGGPWQRREIAAPLEIVWLVARLPEYARVRVLVEYDVSGAARILAPRLAPMRVRGGR